MKAATARIGALALCASLLVACETLSANQKRVLGTLGGAATGASIGAIAGGGKGAAIGAAAGAVAGLIAAEIVVRSEQQRDVQQDNQVYGYVQGAANAPTVRINQASVDPAVVKPGQKVKFKTDYSLGTPKNTAEVQVQEVFGLTRVGESDTQYFPQEGGSRDQGGWLVEADFKVPKDTPPGPYQVTHRIQTEAGAYDQRESYFTVSE